jgi:hypothetical protein
VNGLTNSCEVIDVIANGHRIGSEQRLNLSPETNLAVHSFLTVVVCTVARLYSSSREII